MDEQLKKRAHAHTVLFDNKNKRRPRLGKIMGFGEFGTLLGKDKEIYIREYSQL